MGNNSKQKDIIKYLLNLGFGDQIINMMIESKPASVDFSGGGDSGFIEDFMMVNGNQVDIPN
jgi:hypothetical protein